MKNRITKIKINDEFYNNYDFNHTFFMKGKDTNQKKSWVMRVRLSLRAIIQELYLIRGLMIWSLRKKIIQKPNRFGS